MKRETFREARGRLLAEFGALGWVVVAWNYTTRTPMKVAHATHHRGVRVWLKAQSVYCSCGAPFSMDNARSICSDYRGATAEELLATSQRIFDW